MKTSSKDNITLLSCIEEKYELSWFGSEYELLESLCESSIELPGSISYGVSIDEKYGYLSLGKNFKTRFKDNITFLCWTNTKALINK